MHRLSRGLMAALCGTALLAAAPAHAGLMDKIFGQSDWARAYHPIA